jgi:hypothetical protein
MKDSSESEAGSKENSMAAFDHRCKGWYHIMNDTISETNAEFGRRFAISSPIASSYCKSGTRLDCQLALMYGHAPSPSFTRPSTDRRTLSICTS